MKKFWITYPPDDASPRAAARNSLISPATYSSSTSCKPLPKVTGSAPISSRSA